MNKTETNTIINIYKDMYYVHHIVNIDKSETLREFKFMIDKLGLKKQRYIVENKIIMERDEITGKADIYEMIFNDFILYNRYVHYDINEISNEYDELQFYMNDEQLKCNKARINYICNN